MKSTRAFVVTLLVLAIPAWADDKKPMPRPGEAKSAEAKPAAAASAEVGKPAPEFALKDVDGKEHKLSSYKGKVVILEWANHECPVCQRHYKDKTMANTYTSFKDKGVVWLAVDSSNFADTKADAIKKWWKDQGSPFPYLLDAPGTVGKSFGAKTTPHMFVIDQKGTLIYAGAIDDNADGSKTKPQNYVTDAVNAALKGTAVATATTKPYGCSVKYKN